MVESVFIDDMEVGSLIRNKYFMISLSDEIDI